MFIGSSDTALHTHPLKGECCVCNTCGSLCNTTCVIQFGREGTL